MKFYIVDAFSEELFGGKPAAKVFAVDFTRQMLYSGTNNRWQAAENKG